MLHVSQQTKDKINIIKKSKKNKETKLFLNYDFDIYENIFQITFLSLLS